MKHRRLKVLRISTQLLVDLIGQRVCPDGYIDEARGLPADAEIINVIIESFGFVELVIASEDFPILKPGEVMSRFEVTYTAHPIR